MSEKRPTSAGGKQYLMIIVDDYSRMEWPYFLERKSNVPTYFERLMGDVSATGVPSTVWCVCSDNATKFVRAEFVELLDRGIRREYIPVGLPDHNGMVERHIAMTLELTMASCLEASRLFGDTRSPATGPSGPWRASTRATC